MPYPLRSAVVTSWSTSGNWSANAVPALALGGWTWNQTARQTAVAQPKSDEKSPEEQADETGHDGDDPPPSR